MTRWMRWTDAFSRFPRWPRFALGARAAMLLGMILVGGAAFGVGRWIGVGATNAQSPVPSIPKVGPGGVINAGYDEDYSNRVVAYIHGNIPIYRVELAEYLIARFGSQRLEFLVNRKIVERACQAKGIVVSDAEIEDQFRRDLMALGPHMTAQLFQDQVLKRYNKTLFEWKEDVIRPKIGLARLVSSEVVVTDADLLKRYEILYGPKVQCRMIVYKDGPTARRAWERLRDSPNTTEAFLTEAKQQYIGDLAAVAGEVPPIHKHFGDPRIEQEAFRLKPGEMSQAFGMNDNTAIILLCQKHLPPDTTKSFERERINLLKEVKDLMLAEKIQEKVVQLRKDAAPRYLLGRQQSIDQVRRDALDELNGDLSFRGVDNKK